MQPSVDASSNQSARKQRTASQSKKILNGRKSTDLKLFKCSIISSGVSNNRQRTVISRFFAIMMNLLREVLEGFVLSIDE